MNAINKIVGFVANPLSVGLVLVVIGFVLVRRKKTKAASWTLGVAFVWFWFWAMPIVGGWLALPLEEDFPVELAEDMPKADAIVLLGGGVWGTTNHPYAMLNDGADRAWHAARLWKAGKASIIVPSNVYAELCDVKLLVDLGVPREAVVLEGKAVNTEENAKYVGEILMQRCRDAKNTKCAKVLLVTSACHMKRSLYMFQKYAPEIECVPAATDYQVLPWKNEPFKWRSILPDIGAFAKNNAFIHEYIGYYGYKWFR